MRTDLAKLTRTIVDLAFGFPAPVVRTGVYYRPPAFNPATGDVVAAEVSLPCSFLCSPVRSASALGLAPLSPGTETLIIRSSELAGISASVPGDYLVESSTGQRWNVDGARMHITGVFHTVQATRSTDEDWGDLTEATLIEDWGELTAETEFEDRMALT